LLNKPIFVIGTGRCGSTIFHDMLAVHPDISWCSTLLDRWQDKPGLNGLLMTAIDLPLLGSVLRSRFVPSECYSFWEYYIKGFRRPCRDLLAQDVLEHHRRILPALGKLTSSSRSRLLVKLTGWPRARFIWELIPDARFIHVYRDGRAVAASNLRVNFWDGWQGPQNWRWGELDPDLRSEWERWDRSFVALAGIQWKILMRETEKALARIPEEQKMAVAYEDLVDDPSRILRTAVDFCGLEWTASYSSDVARFSLINGNDKWRKDLSATNRKIILEVLSPVLDRYGYGPTDGKN